MLGGGGSSPKQVNLIKSSLLWFLFLKLSYLVGSCKRLQSEYVYLFIYIVNTLGVIFQKSEM